MSDRAALRRKTTRDLIAEELRPSIVRGELAPGQRLALADLASRFQTSLTPAREALQLLASEGLVRIDAYRGAFVGELDPEECEEIYIMRAGLEGLAARLGTQAIDEVGIRRMRRALDKMRHSSQRGAIDRFVEADLEFHGTHYGAAGREGLLQRILAMRRLSERYIRAGYLATGGFEITVAHHGLLLEVVAAGEAQAAEVHVHDDLIETYKRICATLGFGSSDLT